MKNNHLTEFLKRSLEEDLMDGDVTSSSVFTSNETVTGEFRCKSRGVIAGLDAAAALYRMVNSGIIFTKHIEDGDAAETGTVIAEAEGPVIDLMICERLALNILQKLFHKTVISSFSFVAKGFNNIFV